MPVTTESYQFDSTETRNPGVAAALHDLRRLLFQCEARPDETSEQTVRRFDSLLALAIRAGTSLTAAARGLIPEGGDNEASIRLRDEMLASMDEAKLALCLPDGATEVPDAAASICQARAAIERIPALLAALEEETLA